MGKIGSARLGEGGKARGGTAGDSTGREVSVQKWYRHRQGWIILRARDDMRRELIARAMEAACANDNIGYDQGERLSLLRALRAVNALTVEGIAKLQIKTECDCSSLVRVCMLAAGRADPGNFRTGAMPSLIGGRDDFICITDAEICASYEYLRRGDILVTRGAGHTVICLTNGALCGAQRSVYALREECSLFAATGAMRPVCTLEKGTLCTFYGEKVYAGCAFGGITCVTGSVRRKGLVRSKYLERGETGWRMAVREGGLRIKGGGTARIVPGALVQIIGISDTGLYAVRYGAYKGYTGKEVFCDADQC